ncbi:uncharacterized protein LOC141587008 [Silene latifolia]|uniref:uncharacterized protein LOC141587008 n=1 Tax=Silene latifolia TaxID=37657 RepID=UPI003D788A6E
MTDAHCTPSSIHLRGDKLYKDLKKTFWWPGMKKEVAEFVARCLTFQREACGTVTGVPKDIVSDRDASYHTSIGITPFEAFYGRKCRSPVCWDDSTEVVVLGPEMVQDMVKQVHFIRQKMKAAQDRQKSCADLHRRDIEFAVGDKVLLKVSPIRGVMRFSKRRKLSQNSIGPYDILDRNIELDEALNYAEVPKEILDHKVWKTSNGETVLLKVIWSNQNVEEATWEPEEAMREHYPHLFEQDGCKSLLVMDYDIVLFDYSLLADDFVEEQF